MKQTSPWFFIIAFFILITFVLWYEVTVWTECRQTNSFMYCLRVLGNR
jgi:hypothetical protein